MRFFEKAVKIVASIMLAFFMLYQAAVFWTKAFHGFAWDYSINWTAAMALREGLSLYDRVALQQIAISHIGNNAHALFNGRFTSFIGLPTTAISHLPFAFLPYETSVLCYRSLALCAMLLAVFLTGLTLQSEQRWRAWLAGILCLLLWNAFSFSLHLGQVDAWVILSLAIAVFSVSRARWKLAGVAIAVAVLLKISPIWLLFFCLLKRQWSVVFVASICLAMGLLLSCLPQHGADIWQFLTVVLPSLGDSPLHVQNQSLGAFLARLATPDTQLLSFTAGIGIWKIVGTGITAILLLVLYRSTRSTALQAEELAAVILLALLAGPLTWDHYLSWAVIPVMLLAARLSPERILLLFLLLVPLVFPVPYLKADIIASNAWWRVLTGVQISAVLLVAVWAINCCGTRSRQA
ncbi:MAG TPA: glycosyltransferase family 87 protein [Pseudomonadales bacterium]|nr:glycosyltransferase family 87 protein [Pseudomonadales bacterium]